MFKEYLMTKKDGHGINRKKKKKRQNCSFKMQYGILDWILEQRKDISGKTD